MELVSVIMPCFNDGNYLADSISSLESQSYRNVELILIDDGSTDPNTMNALKLAEKIPRHQILHTDHVGPSKARNLGIQNAKGKYILPLDADDKIAPEYIEKAIKLMESSEDIGIVYCYAELFGEKSGRWELPNYSFETMLLDNIIFVTALFRKCDWEAAGGFCQEFQHGMEDYDFWLSIIEMGRIVYQIPEVMFFYRIKPQSRTTRFYANTDNVQATYRLLFNRHKAFYYQNYDIYAMKLRSALIDKINDVNMLLANLGDLKKEYRRIQSVVERIPKPLKSAYKALFRKTQKEEEM